MPDTTYPLALPTLTVTIGGVTTDVLSDTLRVRQLLGNQVDTCNFSVKIPETWRVGTPTRSPTIGQSVTVTISGKKVFTGKITRVREFKIATKAVEYSVECNDQSANLNTLLVNRTYVDALVSDIVTDIMGAFAPTVSLTGVVASTQRATISFGFQYVAQCLQQLADMAGYTWYVDATETLFFFAIGSTSAPASTLSLTDTSQNYDNLTVEPQIDQVRNRVFVQGGQALSDPITEEIDCDGVIGSVFIDLVHQSVIAVLSSGTIYPTDFFTLDGVQQVVGLRGVDDAASFSTFWLLDPTLGTVYPADALTPIPTDGQKALFKYKYGVPIMVEVEDRASIAAVAILDGTDYVATVSGDNPSNWFRLGDTSGTATNSAFKARALGLQKDGAYIQGPEKGVAGAIVNSSDTAVRFNVSNLTPVNQYGDRVRTLSGVVIPISTPAGLGQTPWSIEAWVQTDATPNLLTDRGIVGQYDRKQGGVMLYVASGTNPTYRIWQALNGEGGVFAPGFVDSNTRPTGTAFDHVVATMDLTFTKIYVNGVLKGSDTISSAVQVATSGLEIGNYGYHFGASGNYMVGTIDEVAIYDYALSAAAVINHWQSGVRGGVREVALTDNQLLDFGQARFAAQATLTKYSNVLTEMTWTSWVPGWQAGDSVTVALTVGSSGRMFTGSVVLQTVDIEVIGAQRPRYRCTAVGARFNYVDYQKSLAQRRDFLSGTAQVLNKIGLLPTEQCVFIDGAPVFTQATLPFKVAADWLNTVTPIIKADFWQVQ